LNRIEVSGPWTAFSTGTYMGQSIFLVAGTLTDNVVEIYDLFGNFIDQIVYSIGTSVNYIATGEDLIYIGLNSTSVDVRNFDRTSHF
jgi:hypothetical protein